MVMIYVESYDVIKKSFVDSSNKFSLKRYGTFFKVANLNSEKK